MRRMQNRISPTAVVVSALTLFLTTASMARLTADDDSALACAASHGDIAAVRALLRAGADVNAPDSQGRTPLMRASAAGHVPMVEALLAAKANLDAADRNGLTALLEAVRLDRIDVARTLLAAGADPDVQHRAYGTALDVAQQQGNAEIAALLRSHGARGSGKSVGDLVCVRPWDGQGYCGTVTAIEGSRWVLRVTRLVGCEKGCVPGACSMGRPVGGDQAQSVQVNHDVRIEGACITHTGLPPEKH